MISKLWFHFITSFLKPFYKFKEDRLKLEAAIEADKESRNQRFFQDILEIQKETLGEIVKSIESSNGTIKFWLEGLQNMSNIKIQTPPVNTDQRMWEKEIQMQSEDIEQYIREAVGRF